MKFQVQKGGCPPLCLFVEIPENRLVGSGDGSGGVGPQGPPGPQGPEGEGFDLQNTLGTVFPATPETIFSGAFVDVPGGTNRVNFPEVDARAFGAVGDGVTPNDTAFELALAFLAAAGGGTLIVPTGNFLLTQQMQGAGTNGQLTPGITIRGTSAVGSVLTFTFSGSGGMGDGILIWESTPNQALTRTRIENLTLINTSPTNCPQLPATNIPSSGTSPAITLEWHPYNAFNQHIRIKIQTGGTSGVATFMASVNDGVDYTVQNLLTFTTPQIVPGIGFRATFPAGTYALDDEYDVGDVVGYNGAAVRSTGGGDFEVNNCLIYNWAKGVINDGGLKVSVRNCHFGNTGNPGVVGVPLDAQMAVWLTERDYIFGFQDSTNIFLMENCRIHTLAVGVWHGGGNSQVIRNNEFSQGTQFPCLLGNCRSVLWDANYFEGGGGPAGELTGRGAHFSSANGSQPTLISIYNNFVSNTNRIPLIRAWFPSKFGVLNVHNNLNVLSPNGGGTPPSGTTLVVGTPEIVNLSWQDNFISLSAGTVFDGEPSNGGIYRSHDGPTTEGLLGINKLNSPEAGIHLFHRNLSKSMMRLELPGVFSNKHVTELDPDGLTWTHGSGEAADGTQHGSADRVMTVTTTDDVPVVSASYPIQVDRCATMVIDVIVRPDSASDTSSAWRYWLHVKRFAGNAEFLGAITDSIKESVASVAAPTTYTAGAFDGVVGERQAAFGRRPTVTTGGATPSDAPATCTFTGVDVNGMTVSEAVAVSQVAGTAEALFYFVSMIQIDLTAADGTGATLSFGYAAVRQTELSVDPADPGFIEPLVKLLGAGTGVEVVLDNGVGDRTGRWEVRFNVVQRNTGG